MRRTGIIPGVMIQQFDRERERETEGGREKEGAGVKKNKAGEQGGREIGREDGGAMLKPLMGKKKKRKSPKRKDNKGSVWHSWEWVAHQREKSGRDC